MSLLNKAEISTDDILSDLREIDDNVESYLVFLEEREYWVITSGDLFVAERGDEHFSSETRFGLAKQIYFESDFETEHWITADEFEEYEHLSEFKEVIDTIANYGGEPPFFVREDYFEDYVREEIASIYGPIPPRLVINWEETTSQFRQDYSTIRVDGEDYLYRG